MVQLETIFSLLGSALSIWDNHQKTKFVEKYIKLKEEFYAEKNKDKVNHATLDNIEFEFQLLIDAFNSEVARSQTSNLPK